MGFRSDAVTSWPALPLPGSNLTLRSNADAGIVWVAGSYTSPVGNTVYFADVGNPMPAVFRPIGQLDFPSGSATLHVNGAGQCWATFGSGGTPLTYAWRTFYFTTVTPG